MKKPSIKWIPFLLAMCMFSAAANILAMRTINQLKTEIKSYEHILDTLFEKAATDGISDRGDAVDAAKPASK